MGVGEASLLLAQVLGQNFSILTYDDKIAAWIDRFVREHHLEDTLRLREACQHLPG